MSGAYKMSLFTSALQPDPDFFSGWSDSEKSTLALAAKGELRPFCEVVKARLDASGAELAYMYAILHDRDTASDHITSPVDGGFVAPHIHLLVGFKSRKAGLTPAGAAAALGVQPQMIEKAKPGRHTPQLLGLPYPRKGFLKTPLRRLRCYHSNWRGLSRYRSGEASKLGTGPSTQVEEKRPGAPSSHSRKGSPRGHFEARHSRR